MATDPMMALRAERHKNEPCQIVADFEEIFGRLTATERAWLIERIKASNLYARRA